MDNQQASIPFQEALSGLMSLTQLLGSLRATAGSGVTPTIVLTADGVELRMAGALPHAAPAAPPVSQNALRKLEEGLEGLHANMKNIEHTLTAHGLAIDSVRAALTQNEQLMESMVELMGPTEFTLPQSEDFANIS